MPNIYLPFSCCEFLIIVQITIDFAYALSSNFPLVSQIAILHENLYRILIFVLNSFRLRRCNIFTTTIQYFFIYTLYSEQVHVYDVIPKALPKYCPAFKMLVSQTILLFIESPVLNILNILKAKCRLCGSCRICQNVIRKKITGKLIN